jgi:hypothetical protein
MAAPLTSVASLALMLAAATPAWSQQRSQQAAATVPAEVTQLAGAWELIAQGGQRKCRLTLRPQPAQGGFAVGIPTTCRRATPIVARIAAWRVSEDGFVRLVDGKGEPVLAFEDDVPAMKLKATAADGQGYQLDSMGRVRRAVVRAATPQPAPPRVAFDPTRAPARETLPGIYSMIRYGGQEVCRIRLGTSPGAADNRFLTDYPTRCRDRGLSVFDVVAWRYAGGRLFLIARRGHEMTLLPTGEGQWEKDPPGGSELTLRKLGGL